MLDVKWIKQLFGFLRLTHEQEEYNLVHESIEKGVVFRGTNLWILIFANFIASVGLNMNSTAVIIGAMLISPLMGPINGIGYSIATYNFGLLRKSIKNYGFSVLGGLTASTIYFLITPIHAEHSELLARTSPTIYDVFIAMFGGLAGIVAISSKNKGNVIPGVAIATALMPPLCTAGYGISAGNWSYVMGALYLFVINTVFIALSAMLVSQLLQFPKQSLMLSRQIKNTNIVVGLIIILTVVPSVYLGYTLVRKERFKERANYFVNRVSLLGGNYLLSESIDENKRKITLVYGGSEFSEEWKQGLLEKAEDLGLDPKGIIVKQGLKTSDYTALQSSNSERDQLRGEINRLKASLFAKEKSYDSVCDIPRIGRDLLNEIKSLFPNVESCTFARSMYFSDSTNALPVSMVYFDVTESMTEEEKSKIENWLKKRLKTDQVILRF